MMNYIKQIFFGKGRFWNRKHNIYSWIFVLYYVFIDLSFYSRFNYVVLPEQDKLKEKLESDLLSEGRYEKN